MRADGFHVNWDEVLRTRPGAASGGPTSRKRWSAPGWSASIDEAFAPRLARRALSASKGRPGRLPPRSGWCARRGGVPVSPTPEPAGAAEVAPDALIVELAAGRARSDWRPTTRTTRRPSRRTYGGSPTELGLVVTGSSDFHGEPDRGRSRSARARADREAALRPGFLADRLAAVVLTVAMTGARAIAWDRPDYR